MSKKFEELTDAEKIEMLRAGMAWLGVAMRQFTDCLKPLLIEAHRAFDDFAVEFGGKSARDREREADEAKERFLRILRMMRDQAGTRPAPWTDEEREKKRAEIRNAKDGADVPTIVGQ